MDRAVLHRARGDKEAKYRERLQGNRCHLVVVGVETGGRWSSEAATFVDHFASGRVREVPSVSRRSAHLAFRRKWMRMIAISCNRAFAASLVSEMRGGTRGGVRTAPGPTWLICSGRSELAFRLGEF